MFAHKSMKRVILAAVTVIVTLLFVTACSGGNTGPNLTRDEKINLIGASPGTARILEDEIFDNPDVDLCGDVAGTVTYQIRTGEITPVNLSVVEIDKLIEGIDAWNKLCYKKRIDIATLRDNVCVKHDVAATREAVVANTLTGRFNYNIVTCPDGSEVDIAPSY